MKPRNYLSLFLLLALIAVLLIDSNQYQRRELQSISKKQEPLEHVVSIATSRDQSTVEAITPEKEPSLIPPADKISDEELAEFPGAKVIESAQGPGSKPGETLQVRILKTNFKDPYVRTEATLDNQTGNMIARHEMAADHLIATLANDGMDQDFLNYAHSLGLIITYITPQIVKLSIPSTTHLIPTLSTILTNLKHNGLSTEPDYITQEKLIKNSGDVTSQWGILDTDGGVSAIKAWTICSSAASIIVAIIDSGIFYKHRDLVMNMWHNNASTFGDYYGINAYDQNGDPLDDNGHGTHCAGTIGSSNQNGLGIKGIAHKVQLMACKFMNGDATGSSLDAISCIDYAINHGAKILNCSWGCQEPSLSLYQELQKAQSHGVIIVTAAGNDALNDDQNRFYPASYTTTTVDGNGCSYPALDNVIAVAATAPGDDFAFFSNYGPQTIQVAAPGLNILSTSVNGDSDTAYAVASGTSMAAPYVTGALALLEAQNPKLSYRAIISKLLSNTDSLPILKGRTSAGRLNIARALSAH